MKKIYSTQNILYILLFILVFILGIMLIKYMVSKKETFDISAPNPFKDGISLTANYRPQGPPNTFINCYNPGGDVLAGMNALTLTKPEISISFIYHSIGPAIGANNNSFVSLCRVSDWSIVDGNLNARCPGIWIVRNDTYKTNYLHFSINGSATARGTINWAFELNNRDSAPVEFDKTHLFTWVVRNEDATGAKQIMHFFKDGDPTTQSQSFYSAINEPTPNAKVAFAYGREYSTSGSNSINSNIYMKDLTIYDGALTNAQVKSIYDKVKASFDAVGGTGTKGDKGDKGDTGSPGANGIQGATGVQGLQGATGVQGLPGATGLQGPEGPQGYIGPSGLVGAAGPVGPTGPAGDVGPAGPAGADGSPGLLGPMGSMGPLGPMGPMGPKGQAGAIGPMGPKGPVSSNSIASTAGKIQSNGDDEDDYCEE